MMWGIQTYIDWRRKNSNSIFFFVVYGFCVVSVSDEMASNFRMVDECWIWKNMLRQSCNVHRCIILEFASSDWKITQTPMFYGLRVKTEPGKSNKKRNSNHSAAHLGLRRNKKAANSQPRCDWHCVGACCKRQKIKIIPVHVMKAYRENRGTAPIILTRSARLRFVGNFMPGGFTLGKKLKETKSG